MILLEVNGTKYQGFISAQVQISLDQLASSFSFVSTSNYIKDYPIKNIAECEIFVMQETPFPINFSVLNGYIDIISPSYSANSHTINIRGRSKTSVLVDSSVWDKKTFKAPVNFITIATKVVSDLDLDISVINQFGVISNFTKDISAEVGETAFSFLERLARKKQILLISDEYGNLVLTRSETKFVSTILLNQKGNSDNNILNAGMSYDFTRRYSKYTVVGQGKGDLQISNENQTSQSGSSSDSDALSSKKLIIVAEQEINLETAQNYAKWEANIRRANSQVYRATVQGHQHASGLWWINTLVKVVDEYADIDSNMLLKEVTFTEDNTGTYTDLVLVSPDAYTLEAQRSIFEKAVDKIGTEF